MDEALQKVAGIKWLGTGELWLDAGQDDAHRCECTLQVEANAIAYGWFHEGKGQSGRFSLSGAEVGWSDTWHQSDPVKCARILGAAGLLACQYSYSMSGDWRWRVVLSQRPTAELVLQMTNIAPWGEELRAVRMIFKARQS
jgi:hypothetical protein